MEPYAAPLEARLNALRILHDKGCKTWVSIEPFPTPNVFDQDLDLLLQRVIFVDRIIFGRMHYNKEVTAFKHHREFFNESAAKIVCFCEENGISYHIKSGTITKTGDGYGLTDVEFRRMSNTKPPIGVKE